MNEKTSIPAATKLNNIKLNIFLFCDLANSVSIFFYYYYYYYYY